MTSSSLYRIELTAARDGVPLARSTLRDWIWRISVALQPLADRLAKLLRERNCLHAEETPVNRLLESQGATIPEKFASRIYHHSDKLLLNDNFKTA